MKIEVSFYTEREREEMVSVLDEVIARVTGLRQLGIWTPTGILNELRAAMLVDAKNQVMTSEQRMQLLMDYIDLLRKDRGETTPEIAAVESEFRTLLKIGE